MLKCRDLYLCPDETAVHVDFVIALLLFGTLLQKKKNFKIYKKKCGIKFGHYGSLQTKFESC